MRVHCSTLHVVSRGLAARVARGVAPRASVPAAQVALRAATSRAVAASRATPSGRPLLAKTPRR